MADPVLFETVLGPAVLDVVAISGHQVVRVALERKRFCRGQMGFGPCLVTVISALGVRGRGRSAIWD